MIDSRAVIDPSAKIAANVTIGPFTVVGPDVEIGEGTWIGSNALVRKNTKIGANNVIHSFASIGNDSQDLKYKGEEAWLIVGDQNIFREFCTVNRGSGGEDATVIGNNNLFMSYTHVAHDCIIGNNVVFSNCATVAGHVTVDDHAILSGGTMVHQFCHIGAYSFFGGFAGVSKDILPYVLVKGDPATPRTINVIGLRRHGFSDEAIGHIRHAYKILFRRGYKIEDARAELEKMLPACPELDLFIKAIDRSTRGIARPLRSDAESDES